MAVYQGSLTVKRRAKDGVPGNPGNPGLPGQVPIQKEWVVGDTHRFNDEIKDYIYVRGTSGNTSYWYTRTSKGDDIVAGAAPVGGASVAGYTRVDWLKTLAVNVLLAEEANLANFIFKGEQLISVRGTVNGVETNYSGQANFNPYIILDGKTGKIYAEEAEISGVINATSGKFTGEVNATDGNIGGMSIAGDTIVSENGRLVIDGTNNTIYLLDDSGSIKTVIRPGNIPTSVSSYFSGSLNQNVSFTGIKGTVAGTTTKDSTTISLSGSAYEVTIPPLTLAASATYASGVGSSILTLKLVLSNGGSANDILIAQVMAISTGTAAYEQVEVPQTKKMITKSGTWRLRLISTAESIGGGTATNNGSLTSSATTFNVSEIVNKSEIGSNGMMIATSSNNYNFMVGGTFEVRRGNSGLQITNSGIKKWNGTSWVTANI